MQPSIRWYLFVKNPDAFAEDFDPTVVNKAAMRYFDRDYSNHVIESIIPFSRWTSLYTRNR